MGDENSFCVDFVKLVEQRKFQAAEAMLSSGRSVRCDETNYWMALAALKAAAFEFDEAERILESEVNKNPDNSSLQQAWNHMVRLLDQSTEFLPVKIWPTGYQNVDDLTMIAWMHDSVPQKLGQTTKSGMYFPIKVEHGSGIGFDQETSSNYKHLPKLTRKLQAKRYEEVGPGFFLPDSSLMITALKSLPYASGPKANRLDLVEFDREANYKGPLSVLKCDCNNAFPVYQQSDSVLIFSSDRAGGFGGMDLWKTKLKNGKWSAPLNLGAQINSAHNEVFATLSGDTLFFSSDREYSGFGGYDIYGYQFSTLKIWNLGIPLNGPYDEHSMHVTGPGNGFIVSNRSGDLGGGNIFKTTWTVIEAFFDKLTGHITNAGDLTGQEVLMLNEDGAILQRTTVGSDGKFLFRHVAGRETYIIELPETSLPERARLQLFDGKDKLIQEVNTASKKGFMFVLLSPKEYILDRVENEDESLLSVSIFGKLDKVEKEDKGFKIILLDSEGEIIATTWTGDQGQFEFASVTPDDKYRIVSEVSDADRAIHILDQNGNLVETIMPDSIGGYAYVRIRPEDGVITLSNEYNKRVRISDKDLFALGVVNYEYNSTEIIRSSAQVLDQLGIILKTNPDIELELSGHTDSNGSHAYNLKLSKERINSAIAYLESVGIPRSRLSGTGYGESALLNHCADGVECSEEEHAVNRRTDFRLRQTVSKQTKATVTSATSHGR
jgi:outer membrane protein OmpA-like peptidoglycan-associated protein